MRSLYNVMFTIGFVLAAPYYFLRMWRRGNWRTGFRQRFGKYNAKIKQSLTNRHVLWLHAVSVGEVNIGIQLIRALEPRVPNLKIVVSTTTSTGMEELRRKTPAHITKIYYPIDRPKYVQRALSVVHPEAVVLVESEIWPNFIWRLKAKGIPLFLVNARLSSRSFKRYRQLSPLFRPLFATFAGVGAQNESDADRLRSLGCRDDAVQVVGSLKYDGAILEERRNLDVPAMLRRIGLPDGSPILIGGSTHAGEEAMLADVFVRLRPRYPDLFLVVVPRHFERGKEAGRDISSRGLRLVYRSEITAGTSLAKRSVDCLLVNTTGELRYFYEEATVVFVGKSMTAEGGQNPIEPARLGKAIVFGPNMQNFSTIASEFLANSGAIQVQDTSGLERAIDEILSNETRRSELGRNAAMVVRRNLGAVERTVEMIVKHLEGGELYVAPD